MAERRMFARSVIGGARFLRMPATSRLLYYDLGMAADDDGCVEAFAVMRMTGATEDDLNVLVAKGFVRLLNEDLVVYITDWTANNQIRKDRYHEGRYKDLIDCKTEVPLLADGQPETNCQPYDNQAGDNPATEVRLGKVSIGKVSIVQESIDQESIVQESPGARKAGKPPAPARQRYGSFGWVRLTENEYKRLVTDFGETEAQRCIAYIDEAAQSTGNKNKWRDWNLVIRKCHREGWGLSRTANNRGGTPLPDYGGNEQWSL